jgi:hypothetical protein
LVNEVIYKFGFVGYLMGAVLAFGFITASDLPYYLADITAVSDIGMDH